MRSILYLESSRPFLSLHRYSRGQWDALVKMKLGEVRKVAVLFSLNIRVDTLRIKSGIPLYPLCWGIGYPLLRKGSDLDLQTRKQQAKATACFVPGECALFEEVGKVGLVSPVEISGLSMVKGKKRAFFVWWRRGWSIWCCREKK